jgi:hypothetical protein
MSAGRKKLKISIDRNNIIIEVNPVVKAIAYLVTKVNIVFDKLNTYFPTSARRKKSQVSVEQDNIIVKSESEHETFSLADLQCAILTCSGYLETMDLLLGFSNGRLIQVSEENPHWMALLNALDRSGKIGQLSAYWYLEFLAKGCRPPINLMEKYPPQTNQPSTEISTN